MSKRKRSDKAREPRTVVRKWRDQIADVTEPIKKWRKLSYIKAVSHDHYTDIKAAIDAMDMACASGSEADIAAAGLAEVKAWKALAKDEMFASEVPDDEPVTIPFSHGGDDHHPNTSQGARE